MSIKVYTPSSGAAGATGPTGPTGPSGSLGTSPTITPSSASAVALTVQGLASQTGDLEDWKNSSGTTLAKIDASGNFSTPSLSVSGLTGATQPSRYVGSTTSGAPASGTFSVGDFIVDHTATIWVCVSAGTPGTWWPTISSDIVLRSANATATVNETTVFTGSSANQTINAPANPQSGAIWKIVNRGTVPTTAGFSTNQVYVLGTTASVSSYAVPVGGSYTFVNYNGGNWYMIESNDADDIVNQPQWFTSATLTNNLSLPTGSDTRLSFVANIDPNNWWNASTKAWTPTVAGNYYVALQVLFASGTAGTGHQTNIQISKNGSTQSAIAQIAEQASGIGISVTTSAIVAMNGSTDYIAFTAYSSDAMTISGGSGSQVSIFKVG